MRNVLFLAVLLSSSFIQAQKKPLPNPVDNFKTTALSDIQSDYDKYKK